MAVCRAERGVGEEIWFGARCCIGVMHVISR